MIFVFAHAFDGVFTYWGVNRLGIDVEVNALLATAMQAFGALPTVLGTKVLACICGLFLYIQGQYAAIAVGAGACLGLGVVPWLLVMVLI